MHTQEAQQQAGKSAKSTAGTLAWHKVEGNNACNKQINATMARVSNGMRDRRDRFET